MTRGIGPESGARGASLAVWARDLALGIRLAVGGGSSGTALVRLVLGAIGTAVAFAVLLVAASAGSVAEAQRGRAAANFPNTAQVPGVEPLHWLTRPTEVDGQSTMMVYLHASGATAPWCLRS